ncbi:VC0807 family protein [Segniliparus rotundus]|nr:VC0807 family protein [Segniliparus rotundus]
MKNLAKRVWLNVGLVLAAYYAARVLGAAAWVAVIAGITVSALLSLATLLRERKANIVSLVVMALLAFSLAVGLTTHNAQQTQVANTLPGALTGLALLISWAAGKPLTKLFSEKALPGFAENDLRAQGWTPDDMREWDRMHRRTTFFCGLTYIALILVALLCIFHLPVDIAQCVTSVLGTSMMFVVFGSVSIRIRAFARTRGTAHP